MNPVSLSIVLPCHNEEDVLPNSIARLNTLIKSWLDTHITSCELVLVNNGSTDSTLEVMSGLTSEVAEFLILDLRRNFGYQGSISAGLHHATKDVVITIDSDLQDDPEKIPEMLERFADGYELVLGVRRSRRSDSFLKRNLSQFHYRLMKLLGIDSVYNHGDYRLMSRSLVEEFKLLSETNRYIRGLVLQLESEYAVVSYERTRRQRGATKFTPFALLNLALDGFTSLSIVPIRLVTLFGVGVSLVALVGFILVFYVALFTQNDVPGWASLATITLFFAGVHAVCLGIVGEYVAKTYMETKRRPVFSVRRTIRK